MLPTQFEQVTVEDARSGGLDLFISACGYERRSTHAATYLGTVPRQRVCLRFEEYSDHARTLSNRRTFEGLGYESYLHSGDDYRGVVSALAERIADPALRRVGIDISSMTRSWYWGLTMAISKRMVASPLEVFYFYTPARFATPRTLRLPPRVFGPIPGLSNSLELPDRGISLLIGLGYEADKALGLVEYLEARNTWLFYTEPAADKRFTQYVLRANEMLFQRVEPENVVKYRYNNLSLSMATLDSLVRGLVRNSRVLIAPLGPKPFGLVAFLLSLLYPEVDVWRVSGGAFAAPQVREPIGEILVARVLFSSGPARASC